jgi:hypothetical protein
MAKSIREQLLERNYWKKVNLVREELAINSSDINLLSRYEDTILRLERLALKLDRFQADETLELVSLYFNGIFVYEQNVLTGALINALPNYYSDIRILEILLNEKLAIICEPKRVILNMLDEKEHQHLIKQLRSTDIWEQMTRQTIAA